MRRLEEELDAQIQMVEEKLRKEVSFRFSIVKTRSLFYKDAPFRGSNYE